VLSATTSEVGEDHQGHWEVTLGSPLFTEVPRSRGVLRSTGGEPLTCGPAEAGPSGVPEEHHAALPWHA
jgi:hypothetical protein